MLQRLQRLIRWIGWRVGLMNTDRCALCRERPLVALIPAARGGYDVGPPVSTEPCPGCGWQPDVIEVFGSPASHGAGTAIAASHLYFDDAMGWGVIRNLTGKDDALINTLETQPDADRTCLGGTMRDLMQLSLLFLIIVSFVQGCALDNVGRLRSLDRGEEDYTTNAGRDSLDLVTTRNRDELQLYTEHYNVTHRSAIGPEFSDVHHNLMVSGDAIDKLIHELPDNKQTRFTDTLVALKEELRKLKETFDDAWTKHQQSIAQLATLRLYELRHRFWMLQNDLIQTQADLRSEATRPAPSPAGGGALTKRSRRPADRATTSPPAGDHAGTSELTQTTLDEILSRLQMIYPTPTSRSIQYGPYLSPKMVSPGAPYEAGDLFIPDISKIWPSEYTTNTGSKLTASYDDHDKLKTVTIEGNDELTRALSSSAAMLQMRDLLTEPTFPGLLPTKRKVTLVSCPRSKMNIP